MHKDTVCKEEYNRWQPHNTQNGSTREQAGNLLTPKDRHIFATQRDPIV
ncbi:hypothetical protein PORCRE_386 [Porphyromonas crevioricanis JCM 15906]|uniref:Uncharacterized protein n=1 Tax=Porphyromonas crevioricanis JCM 15906 TaxID=1305617 RepID=S4PGG4_9PORP|nr:hypothetical protein PORCRE_386 [Porphyromonas crevioricanis JCM 15906]